MRYNLLERNQVESAEAEGAGGHAERAALEALKGIQLPAAAPLRGRAARSRPEALVREILGLSGVAINGPNPWDIQVHDDRFYQRVVSEHLLGLGESYMDGWWDCAQLDEFIGRILTARMRGKWNLSPTHLLHAFASRLFNMQSRRRASQVCEEHYDLGNDLYQLMLDPTMAYTCAYWKDATNLHEAQLAKFDLICRKLKLEPGMKILDIGCGWGSFMKFAAERYGVECVGYSLSKEQTFLGEELCRGLPVSFILQDYRAIEGKFDRVISIGMFEAVGYKNFRSFMEVVNRSLADDGIALLHTMGNNRSQKATEAWFHKYIFPNGLIPSLAQIGQAAENLLMIEDLHNIGPDYDRTLCAWNENFQRAWPRLSADYSPRFKRMWEFYLLSFAGGFRSRNSHLWQLVLTKPGRRQPDCRAL